MKRNVCVFGLAALILMVVAGPAYPWGYATHAYIDDGLNKQLGERNLNEIYGGMSPDIFNFSFGLPVFVPGGIYEQFHYGFMDVWNQKKTGQEKALAYGFISHNDLWGADSTAHHQGLTPGFDQGYVIAKVELISQIAPLPDYLEVPAPVAMELYHSFVEFGLDILTVRLDSEIGSKITRAAKRRSPDFPFLLADAFADDLVPFFGSEEFAAQMIVYAEGEFRQNMGMYGQILTLPEPLAVEIMAEYLGLFAESYLAQFDIVLPANVDIEEVIGSYLFLTLEICETDYMDEVSATIDYLDARMKLEGVGNSQ